MKNSKRSRHLKTNNTQFVLPQSFLSLIAEPNVSHYRVSRDSCQTSAPGLTRRIGQEPVDLFACRASIREILSLAKDHEQAHAVDTK